MSFLRFIFSTNFYRFLYIETLLVNIATRSNEIWWFEKNEFRPVYSVYRPLCDATMVIRNGIASVKNEISTKAETFGVNVVEKTRDEARD